MIENTKVKDLYNIVKGDRGELNSDWTHNVGVYVPTMSSDITVKELVNLYTQKVDFSVDGLAANPQYRGYVSTAIQWLTEHYPDVKYSTISKYFNPYVIENGLSVNHCLVNIHRHIVNTHKNLSTCNSVIEIGAGYGAFAREIFLCNKNMKYVIIDLPESLLCSYSYLSLEFQEKNHVILNNKEDLNKPFDFLYIPIKSLNLFLFSGIIKNFDLFVNTNSMGEMTRGVLNKYYDMLTNLLTVKSAYWVNRFLNDLHGPWRKNEMFCSIDIPKQWHIKHWEHKPLWSHCPHIVTILPVMTELYADIQNTNDVLENSYINKSNTLFHAWNEVRLYPNKNAVNYLIKLIEQINPRAEELMYYKELQF